MYDARSGEFRELNQTGADIWRLIVAGNEEDAVVIELGRSYEATNEGDWEILRHDVRAFVRDLVGALVLVAEEDHLHAGAVDADPP